MLFEKISGRRIMVVEDEYHVAQRLKRGLEDASAIVLGPVPSVAEAIDLLDAEPDAVVLDINLRGEMAFGVADALAAAGVPFLFATGYEQASLPDEYASVVHLQKPVEMTMLLSELNSLLEPGSDSDSDSSAGLMLCQGEPREMLRQIIRDFEVLLSTFDKAEPGLSDDNGDFEFRALQRARQAAQRGIELSLQALSVCER